METVTVIMPVYNSEKYILESLKALEAQTYKNFVLLIVNDGSTDRSADIIKEYKSKNDMYRIKYIEQENCGVSKARNTGIDNTETKLITFLDSDDIYSPIFLESLVNNRSRGVMVCCEFTRDINKCKQIYQCKCKLGRKEKTMKDILHRKKKINFVGCIFETSLIRCNKIRFSEGIKYGEDNEFLWKYLCHIKKIKLVDAKLYGYRINEVSAMNLCTRRIEDAVLAAKSVVAYSKRNGNEIVYRLVRNYYIPRMKIAISKEYCRMKRFDWFDDYRKNFNRSELSYIIKEGLLIEKCGAIMLFYFPIAFYGLIRLYYRN